MKYAKYTDEDLLEAHDSMMDYSGKIDESLNDEIQGRGGLDRIKRNIRDRNIIPEETRRINILMYTLYTEGQDTEAIKKIATSEILDQPNLDQAVDLAIENAKSRYKNVSVNSRTIIGSIIGIFVSSLLSAGLWWYTILLTGKIYYILVFLSTFISAFIAIPIGLWIYRIITS